MCINESHTIILHAEEIETKKCVISSLTFKWLKAYKNIRRENMLDLRTVIDARYTIYQFRRHITVKYFM